MSSFEPQPGGRARSGFVPDDAPPRVGGFQQDGAAEPVATGEVSQPCAEPDPEAARREAWDEGFRAGEQSLPWREARQLEGALEALRAAAEAATELRRQYLGEHRRLAVELSLDIAECLLGRAVEADPELLAGRVARAIEAFEDPGSLCVKLSEGDHDAVRAGLGSEWAGSSESPALRFEVDAALLAGEFRLEGERSRVDARWSELLGRVREELLASLRCEVPGS